MKLEFFLTEHNSFAQHKGNLGLIYCISQNVDQGYTVAKIDKVIVNKLNVGISQLSFCHKMSAFIYYS